MPRPCQPSALRLYLRQFKNPLVYLLLLATLVSPNEWALVGVIAASLVLVMELYKRLFPRSETED